jgi:hypothetical protein
MKKFISLLLTTIMLQTSVSVFANPSVKLPPFIKKPDKSFVISSKSRSVQVQKGQSYRMKMKLHKNRYYFIALKGKRFLGQVQCQIIVPSENNKVVFDNAAYEFDNNILFFNENDREVVIEIKTMPGCFDNEYSKKGNIKLVLANKKLRKKEEIILDTDYNFYAVN